ncbi:DNA topoisomerase III [Bacillus cereus]|nr:DNA topoisomerase III [Bacillus cereus]
MFIDIGTNDKACLWPISINGKRGKNMRVILAEKSSQAQAYCDAMERVQKKDGYYTGYFRELDETFVIVHAKGHLMELYDPIDYKEEWGKWNLKDLPIIPEEFKFKLKTDKESKRLFEIARKQLRAADSVIVGTDGDREGENIARLIMKMAGCEHKPTQRLWINSLVPKKVKEGLLNLQDGNKYKNKYEEAQGRQRADWIVGINASRLFTLALKDKGINEKFSVGRVQSATLKLIYDRQIAIEQFEPKPIFSIEAKVNTNPAIILKTTDKFEDKSEFQKFIREHRLNEKPLKAIITDVEKEIKPSFSPKLFSLATLQTYANKKYKLSPKKVLDIVQTLYDSPLKLVTYPRSDCEYITENEFEYIQKHVKDYQNIVSQPFEIASYEPNKKYIDNKKVKEHYAIVPTENIPSKETLDSLTKDQRNIYFAIVTRTIAMFHKPYEYEETVISAEIQDLSFYVKGKVEITKGWKELYEEETENNDVLLPKVNAGESYTVEIEEKEGKTSPPKPLTEGQLIPLMQTCGLRDNDFSLEDEEETSEAIKILKEVEGLGTSATRAGIIETLQDNRYIEIKNNKVIITKKGRLICEMLADTLLTNPLMTGKWELFLKEIGEGKQKKETFIFGISKFVEKLIEAKKVSIKSMDLGEEMEEIQKEKEGAICECPICKKGNIVDRKSFFGCTNYKEGCKFTISKTILGKNITKAQVKKLCDEKGKTGLIKGFEKDDKTFDAFLKREGMKINFEFEKKVVKN